MKIVFSKTINSGLARSEFRRLVSDCVKQNLTPNTFKIQNPLQEVSIENTHEINAILHEASSLMIKSTIKYLNKKVKQTLASKNKAFKKLFNNVKTNEKEEILTKITGSFEAFRNI